MAKSLNPKQLGGMNQRPVSKMNQRPSNSGAGFRPIKTPTKAPQASQKNIKSVTAKTPQRMVPAKQAPTNMGIAGDLINMMRSMVGGFAILDESVIEQNLRLAAGNGMTMEDRTLSFECVDYLMSNMGFIFMGLVLDANFKDAFIESLSVEMSIDQQPPEVKAKAREAMKDTKPYESAGSICIGVTSFSPQIAQEFMNKMNHSFDILDPFAKEFDDEAAKLTQQQRVELGFIFSNFMYLIRAFAKNDMFMAYVITVIEKVKEITLNQ